MKKIIIIAIMAIMVAGFIFAYPNQHRGHSNKKGYTMDEFTEIKELTGELVINEDSFPAIKISGGEETIITLGQSTVESLKLKNGSKITVNGYNINTSDGTIFEVTQLDYNNKTYEVHGYGNTEYDNGRNCCNNRNSGYGRHGGRR